jgi:drug/metabolite transporter (DMT)-like permease
VSAVVGAPLALAFWHVNAAAWPFIAVSSVLEVAYFALLATAYRYGELSVVYPLARGLAPVLVLIGTITSVTGHQILGVLLVASGVLLVRGFHPGRGTGFGVAIACCIASYTVVDKHGVAHASPLAYLELVSVFLAAAYLSAFVVVRGAAAVRGAFGWRPVVAGAATFAAYGLVLEALTLAPAASVAAVRETSVLFGALLGWVVLKERATRWRVGGVVLVTTGVVLVSLS